MFPGLDLFLPFLAAVLLLELTPGPNMGYLAIVATRYGRRAGLTTILGVTAGLTVYMLAAVFGLTAVILRMEWLYSLLRWAGVAYLLWLALDVWRSPEGDVAGIDEAPSAQRFMIRGLLANLLNPKAAVFYITLLPAFTDPARPFAPQALTLGLTHIAVSIVIHTTIVLLTWRAASLVMPDGARRRGVRAVFALMLAAIALWMAWETRR
ncbi:MAG: LysE family translocator [Caulobacter sp.]|nr:LysE family translocator [Caulobacter sp.]